MSRTFETQASLFHQGGDSNGSTFSDTHSMYGPTNINIGQGALKGRDKTHGYLQLYDRERGSLLQRISGYSTIQEMDRFTWSWYVGHLITVLELLLMAQLTNNCQKIYMFLIFG
eukprot:996413_1